ncbi:MAG: aspartate/glutamate racemase family protein [Phycisphaerales bacterium]|nr:MAG: aspartate/glutamate racemase family protein [Phycisphaerales bacterium]
MKLIGLIGGMTWQSTLEYYRLINEMVGERLGGHHSARLLLHSVDFEPIEQAQHEARWNETADMLADAARALARGGADFIVLCTNTMHKVADAVESAAGRPLIHIADATAAAIQRRNLKRVALLGTRFTMEDDFYKARLQQRFGLVVLVPPEPDRQQIHRVIYDELSYGRTEPQSRQSYQNIIAALADRGAQGVILGCTEIPLLIRQQDVSIPVFDTTRLHAEAAVAEALS